MVSHALFATNGTINLSLHMVIVITTLIALPVLGHIASSILRVAPWQLKDG